MCHKLRGANHVVGAFALLFESIGKLGKFDNAMVVGTEGLVVTTFKIPHLKPTYLLPIQLSNKIVAFVSKPFVTVVRERI